MSDEEENLVFPQKNPEVSEEDFPTKAPEAKVEPRAEIKPRAEKVEPRAEKLAEPKGSSSFLFYFGVAIGLCFVCCLFYLLFEYLPEIKQSSQKSAIAEGKSIANGKNIVEEKSLEKSAEEYNRESFYPQIEIRFRNECIHLSSKDLMLLPKTIQQGFEKLEKLSQEKEPKNQELLATAEMLILQICYELAKSNKGEMEQKFLENARLLAYAALILATEKEPKPTPGEFTKILLPDAWENIRIAALFLAGLESKNLNTSEWATLFMTLLEKEKTP